MSRRQSFYVILSTFCLVLLLPVMASAQYTRDEVLSKLRDGFGRGDVASLVEGMPQGLPVRLEFPEISMSRNVGRSVNAAAMLEQVFKGIHPKFFLPRPGWDGELKKSQENTDDVSCTLRGQWRVEIDGQSQLRELYIKLRNDGDQWYLIGIRSAPPEQ